MPAWLETRKRTVPPSGGTRSGRRPQEEAQGHRKQPERLHQRRRETTHRERAHCAQPRGGTPPPPLPRGRHSDREARQRSPPDRPPKKRGDEGAAPARRGRAWHRSGSRFAAFHQMQKGRRLAVSSFPPQRQVAIPGSMRVDEVGDDARTAHAIDLAALSLDHAEALKNAHGLSDRVGIAPDTLRKLVPQEHHFARIGAKVEQDQIEHVPDAAGIFAPRQSADCVPNRADLTLRQHHEASRP
ncbi:MAG: translation initiation factor IF-2 [Microviridae sp.]|nr:MAG: translation initiation factor IF-2 [Microviridae sp.]